MYLWTSVTPQQMKMRQRVRKALCSNETLSRYSVERQNEDGGGVESGFGGGGEGWNWREPTGREPGQLEHPGGLRDSNRCQEPGLLRAPEQGTSQDPRVRETGSRDPPKPRDQKGAQVITHRNEWGRRSGGGAEEGPRGGRGTSPSPSPNP